MSELRIGEIMAKALLDEENPVECVGNSAIIGYARQNDKRPAFIQYTIPDEWAKNLQNEPDAYILCRFSGSLFRQIAEEDPNVDTVPVVDGTDQVPEQAVTQE